MRPEHIAIQADHRPAGSRHAVTTTLITARRRSIMLSTPEHRHDERLHPGRLAIRLRLAILARKTYPRQVQRYEGFKVSVWV